MKQIVPVIINYLLIFFCITMKTFSQDPGAINKDANPVLISKQFSFTEGPAADRNGNIYFTDQPNNKIWKYDVRGKLSVFMDSSGRSNGMYFDSKGNLVTCADEKNQLWSIDPKGKVTVLLNDFHGQRFNGPNDLWIDHKDGIYFTDPYFERDYWHRKGPQPEIKDEILYYLPKGKTMPIVVDADLKKPNGIVGTNDRHLYVSDMGVGKIFKYYIADDGTLKNRSVFVADLADGMTIDNKGNLYLAGRGVTVYNSHGKKIKHFDIPAAWTANLCFGGVKRDILFITASESIYKMRMKVTGLR
jgi:Gluconolactonase